jgi:hypothetical protein
MNERRRNQQPSENPDFVVNAMSTSAVAERLVLVWASNWRRTMPIPRGRSCEGPSSRRTKETSDQVSENISVERSQPSQRMRLATPAIAHCRLDCKEGADL